MRCQELAYAYAVGFESCDRRKSLAFVRPPDLEALSAKFVHRLTAKALVLVLLFGTFVPFAASALTNPAQVPGAHCTRHPVPERTEPSSGCHHHNATAETAAVPPLARDLRSKPCCDEHACCRSQARTQWANVRLGAPLQRSDRAQEPVSRLAAQSYSVDVEHYLPARAPPAR